MSDQLTLLGVGSSAGTPVVGCECSTCKSNNKKNHRWYKNRLEQVNWTDSYATFCNTSS